eukprot:6032879-Amphidinium_carterae.1
MLHSNTHKEVSVVPFRSFHSGTHDLRVDLWVLWSWFLLPTLAAGGALSDAMLALLFLNFFEGGT